jgi:hypothetical protein
MIGYADRAAKRYSYRSIEVVGAPEDAFAQFHSQMVGLDLGPTDLPVKTELETLTEGESRQHPYRH